MSPKTIITFGVCSDVGMVREDNQDSYGKFPEGDLDISAPKGQLFIVADGMGGHVGGREASEMAVNTIHESYFKDDVGPVPAGLRHAFEQANARIYEFSTSHPRYANMGTTCSALALKDDRGYVNHIGDSRIYRVTQSSIEQLTNDHSRVAELQRRGLITKEEARYHPERSHLYRALGVRPTAEVDAIEDVHLNGNEYFVLCSDGLVNHVEEGEIKDIVLNNKPQEACERLVALANEHGGTDNITVLVVQVSATDSGS
jgi:protein phosphatase